MIIQEPVQAAIWHCLNNYDHKDAVFLAERLCAEVESDETIFLLATSYYRSKQLYQAYWLLKEKSRRSPQCRFLQARCAYELKKYAAAESALTNSNFSDLNDFEEICKDFGDIACFALQLIAQICLKTERTSIASSALRKALKLNPFMWHAFADLCNMGEDVDAGQTFHIQNTKVFETCQSSIITNSMIVYNGNGNVNMSNNNSMKSTLNDSTNQINNNQTTGIDSQSINYHNIACTPIVFIEQQQQQQLHLHHHHQQQNQSSNLNTSNNNVSLNGSMTMLRGGGGGIGLQHFGSQGINVMIDDTPNSGGNEQNFSGGVSGGGGGGGGSGNGTILHFENNAGTPFRRQFKYLSTFSPATPSFGVLPLNSPTASEASPYFSSGNINVPNQSNLNVPNLTPSPHNTLTEVGKKVRNADRAEQRHHVGGVGGHTNFVNRRDTSSGGHMIINNNNNNNNKPAVFTQTGNITPRTPNNTSGAPLQNAAVRRSSRLFSNSAYSVKENNKSPNINTKFAQPRSPPRKTKLRMAKICLNNELIEDKSHNNSSEKNVNKKNKEKIETITSPHSNGNMANIGLGLSNSNNNNNRNGGMIGSGGGSGIIHNTISNNDMQQQQQQQQSHQQQQQHQPQQQHQQQQQQSAENKVLFNNSLNNAQTLSHHLLNLKKQSADGLMTLLRDIGDGYKLLTKYQCKAAIQHLEANIPKHHLCSSWVQSLIAISQYELREYEAAVSIFRRVHETEPYRLEYMEIYSSSLWHLQREVDLSALAQDLIGQDKMSSITWCVAGNCFSLQKEHETAIKFFKRAVQVDPDFVYSYTLLGHELVLTEELDKALDYFRAAVVRDSRHYNAWFGIGTVYSKQEKYELAELHYIKALKINPQNSVILVHIGAMQCFMQRKEQALQTLNTAATLDPKNPLARFHRGSIYFSLGRHQEALQELEELKEIVPKESVVFYLIGKIHKTLGNVDLALMHFSWATDLDPKGANTQIKDAFDSVTYPSCCPPNVNETDGDIEPVSERSDYSTQTPNDINYDSDY